MIGTRGRQRLRRMRGTAGEDRATLTMRCGQGRASRSVPARDPNCRWFGGRGSSPGDHSASSSLSTTTPPGTSSWCCSGNAATTVCLSTSPLPSNLIGELPTFDSLNWYGRSRGGRGRAQGVGSLEGEALQLRPRAHGGGHTFAFRDWVALQNYGCRAVQKHSCDQ